MAGSLWETKLFSFVTKAKRRDYSVHRYHHSVFIGEKINVGRNVVTSEGHITSGIYK